MSLLLLSTIEFACSNLVPIVASFFLLAYHYRSFFVRLAYTALLCHWYMHNRHGHDIFAEILLELFRSRRSSLGETNLDGRHWTLSIAEIILRAAFSWISIALFPTYRWTIIFLMTCWELLLPRTHVGQLWLYKQISMLARFDKYAWIGTAFALESAFLYLTHLIDFPATRAIVAAVWEVCYQLSRRIDPGTGDKLVDGVFICFLIQWNTPYSKYYTYVIHSWIVYRLYLEKLINLANTHPPEHKYKPLKDPKDIRVLVLLPRFGFRPICCSLVQGPHMRLLFYEAISYTWHSMDQTEEILVDGCRKKVTKSVYEILASYSSLMVPRVLWIDALCIDQGNEAEKSQQVPLMKKIYSNALFTTVFLGRSLLTKERISKTECLMPFRYDGIYPAGKETQKHLEDARLAFDLLNEFRVLEHALKESGMTIYKTYEKLQSSKSRGLQWAALFKMLQHPVFERVWIVQEVALSPHVEVRYGDEVIDWDILASGVELLQGSRSFCLWMEWVHGVKLHHVQHTSLYNVTRMQGFRQTCRPRGDFESYTGWPDGWDTGLAKLLGESFYFKATDPRDLVYGIMSLCRDPIRVSYRDKVEKVFQNAAKELLERGEVNLLLHAAGVGTRLGGNSITQDSPTWVPDWTNTPQYEGLEHVGKSWRQKRRKTDAKPNTAMKLKGNRTLAFSGTYADTIDELGPVIFDSPHHRSQSMLEAMSQFARNYDACWKVVETSSRTSDPYRHTQPHQSLREAFLNTVGTNKRAHSWDSSPSQMAAKISEWEENLKHFCHIPDADSPASRDNLYTILQSMDVVTENIRSQCGGRRVFVTRKGYIGLCPPNTMRGDLIYMVPNVTAPVLLRRCGISVKEWCAPQGSAESVPQSPKTFRLVGECYCHGLNSDQSLSGGHSEDIEVI